MTAEAWVGIVAAAIAFIVAIASGCGAWMLGVYRKLGAIEQGFATFENWMREVKSDRDSMWDAHNNLANRVTRLEARE